MILDLVQERGMTVLKINGKTLSFKKSEFDMEAAELLCAIYNMIQAELYQIERLENKRIRGMKGSIPS